MPAEVDARPAGADRSATRAGRFLFRAPPPPGALAMIAAASAAAALLAWAPAWTATGEGFLLSFLAPALIAAAATPTVARALGGRLEIQRSLFLVVMVLLLELPLVAVGRLGLALVPSFSMGVVAIVLFAQGPALWFRHMSLYGVSTARHGRSLVPALLQPVAAVLLTFLWIPPTVVLGIAAVVFLALGFLCALLLLRVIDRPLRRGFQSSGLSMMRPLIDHVNRRDPGATGMIEGFFLKGAHPANLRITVLRFGDGERAAATIALPTVHPGPFGAIGASDLPRKLRVALGDDAGTVFVPHTPCDHDLDLPSEAETGKVAATTRELLEELATAPGPNRASPLVRPYDGSLARAQIVGDVALVVVSQAPDPTDDISYAVADRLVREAEQELGIRIALVDAHNSYIEDQGDITYGTPAADRLARDARAAVRAALAAARDGPIEVGTSVLLGYDIGRDGIAPEGVRALVIRAAGATSAYVLIDGNNLVHGMRAPILERLLRHVDAAEVMTTDNHVVHESDGSTNPVGGRYPVGALAQDAETVVRAALARARPASVASGRREVPDVLVLAPGFTGRLLTAISDTVSMLGNSLLMTFLLLLLGSLVALLVLA